MARQAKKKAQVETVAEQEVRKTTRSGTAPLRSEPSVTTRPVASGENEERGVEASGKRGQPTAANGSPTEDEQNRTTEHSGTTAWLALQELGEEEARIRYPRVIGALQEWAKDAGSRDLVKAGPTVRIAARREGFRRCGMAHPKAETDYSSEQFTPDELEQLLSEPGLAVELV
ncbi:HI1506-related protein [Nitratireductor sp. GZWM139]|uniref:HI1506-related protein n=1 Tax=Nitratireductor sp. GZWM139 TaxID=2950541 RepID=UPI0024BE6D69|nr:HI1506-related protein [Nitratireductor sp. GZWM139]MDJ1463409.1 HI1506-related protein [Nitratireductor sp. GZWM139]